MNRLSALFSVGMAGFIISHRLCFLHKKHLLGTLIFSVLFFNDVLVSAQSRTSVSDVSGEFVEIETQRLAIRNGSQVPQQIYLPSAQMKAIGWLYQGSPLTRFCTATVIAWDAVITARHCFEDKDTGEYQFPSGEVGFAISQEGEVSGNPVEMSFPFTQSEVQMHSILDLALIRFPTQPFAQYPNLTPIPINRVRLEEGLYYPLLNSTVEAAGYGETYHEGAQGRYFASVKVEMISSRSIIVNGEKNQGICSGDSGGPLLAAGVDGEPTIFALVSGGDKCCVGIDQLTRLDIVTSWIDQYSQANYFQPNPNEVLPLECWGVSKRGTCQGDTLNVCRSGSVVQTPCQEQGGICDFDVNLGQFSCIPYPNLYESCGEATQDGICVTESKIHRCLRGQLVVEECVNSTCMEIEDGQRVACVNYIAYQYPENDADKIFICSTESEIRLSEANKGRLIGAPSCQHLSHNHRSVWLWIILFMWGVFSPTRGISLFFLFILRHLKRIFGVDLYLS